MSNVPINYVEDEELLHALSDVIGARLGDLTATQIIGNLARFLAEFVMTAPPDMQQRFKAFAIECVAASFQAIETGENVRVVNSPANTTTKQ
jgi:hypothetical protein